MKRSSVATSEYLPNAWGRVGHTWHVAQQHPLASDGNAGTEQAPYLTIQAAARRADEYDTIIIDQGIYREEVELLKHGHRFYPESMIIFQAREGARVYLRGSDIFTPNWKHVEGGSWSAFLPEWLFEKDSYNPYALGMATDVDDSVRPCEGEYLPETRGQIYVNGKAYEQAISVAQLKTAPGSFLVHGDGRTLMVNLGEAAEPGKLQIELTVRKRCIRPAFGGTVYIETRGIVIEHAAEPGPFCKGRPYSLRRNPASGIAVRRTYNFPGCSGAQCTTMNARPAYIGSDRLMLHGSIVDDTYPCRPSKTPVVSACSLDAGQTWQIGKDSRRPIDGAFEYSYTFHPRENLTLRHYVDYRNGYSADGSFGSIKHNVMLQHSRDGGKIWSEPVLIDREQRYFTTIVPLADGTLVWPFCELVPGVVNYHHRVGTLVGQWISERGQIEWKQGEWVEVTEQQSQTGLNEPDVVQMSNGCLFMVMRMGAVFPSQDSAGVPSIKYFSTSNDGRTWSKPAPLTYDDGRYLYSPASFQQLIRSARTGRTYMVLNICDRPTVGCDPRTTLHLIEIDQETCCAKRNTRTIIEEKHPEHHDLVRFSNFQCIEEPVSGNLIIFMRQNMSEFCPIRFGYDNNQYRYEIMLPPLD